MTPPASLATAPLNFADRLIAGVRAKKNPVLVGLDPRAESLPEGMIVGSGSQAVAKGYVTFCQGVIDAVASLVCVVKPQAAFFEQLGPAGCVALGEVIVYARQKGLLVVVDAKRNDIGTTAQAYADAYLGKNSPWGGDSLTVSPYLGDDSLTPFVAVAREREAGIFVLVKTSNPGGGRFQDLTADGLPLFQHVAQYVEQLATQTLGTQGYGLVGAVAGATYPAQLAELRKLMPHTWFLIPGYGAQGGTAEDCAAAFDDQGLGAIVNNSRGIIFAHKTDRYRHFGPSRWQDAVSAATQEMIDQFRAETPAGKL